MFSTRVRDAARRHGHECQIVTKAADVAPNLAGADLVVVDLMVPGGGALEAVAAAAGAGVPVVAYGEHVQAEVGVDAGQHEARQERQREQIDHGSVSALASRATSRSNSVR